MGQTSGAIIVGILMIAAAAFLGFCAYTLFIYTPVALYAEAKCLRNGYPNAKVSVGLEIYCTTLDGAVTVKVDKLK